MSELDEKAFEIAHKEFRIEGGPDSRRLKAAIRAYLAAAPAPTVSGEPVAWLRVRDDGRQTFWDRDVDGFCTPLYAHHSPTRAEVLEEQDMLEAGRKYEDNRKPEVIIRDEPFYSGAQLRAAYRHGYDFARALAGQKP